MALESDSTPATKKSLAYQKLRFNGFLDRSTRSRACPLPGRRSSGHRQTNWGSGPGSAQAMSPPRSVGRNGAAPDSRDEQALRELLRALRAARDGDFSVRLNARRRGLLGQLAAEFNHLASTNGRMARELERVRRVIGREGRMT